MNDWVDGYCHDCYNTGEIVVCGWCESGDYHTHCDDTWNRPCGCRTFDHNHRFSNGGLWLAYRDKLWTVCQDFVNYATTKYRLRTYDKAAAIKSIEEHLADCRKQVREDLEGWPEQDRMAFYEWSRGKRKGL